MPTDDDRARPARALVTFVVAVAVAAVGAGAWWQTHRPAPAPASGPVPGSAPASVRAPAAGLVPGPLADVRLFVDPQSRAAVELRTDAGLSRAERSAVAVIAGQPVALWLGEDVPTAAVGMRVLRLLAGAARSGTVPVLVAYAIPHRDCGGLSGGGFSSAGEYRQWMTAFAAGLGSSRAVVVLEPDSLAQAGCLEASLKEERFELLRFAVAALARDPRAVVYLDGGNSRWQPADVMAARLRAAGVDGARGFAVNVANFNTTDTERVYGKAVVGLLASSAGGRAGPGGVGFVIDVSRNGKGALDTPGGWCNPPGRALGVEPSTSDGADGVDALLWIKTPGVSDGVCAPGQPRAGVYWPQYVLSLVAGRAASPVQAEVPVP